MSGGVVTERTIVFANNGAASFEEKRNGKILANVSRDPGARHFSRMNESLHFAWMWREQPFAFGFFEDVDLAGKNVERIGVDHHRLFGLPNELAKMRRVLGS